MLKKRGLTKKINYHNKKYKNPFFHQRRGGQRLRVPKISWSWRGKLVVIEILALLGGVIWFCCFSTFFNINLITVDGLARIPKQKIEDIIWQQTKQKRFLLIPQNNLILFSKNELIKTLYENYCFESLIINKKLPDKLIVNIQEKSYAFVWQEEDKYYYADIDGYIINEINPLKIKQKKYPLIYNRREEGIGDNKINIDGNYIDYIIGLFDEFDSDFYGFEVERFIIDNEVDTIKMAIYEGPTIYFNINEDRTKQAQKLFIIKNEKLKDDFKNKTYIDLRYGDKVYYR